MQHVLHFHDFRDTGIDLQQWLIPMVGITLKVHSSQVKYVGLVKATISAL